MAKDTRTICDWCGSDTAEFDCATVTLPFDIKKRAGDVRVYVVSPGGEQDDIAEEDVCERCFNGALRDAVKGLAVPRKKPAE